MLFEEDSRFTGPPVSDQEVLLAERKLNFMLPAAYVEMLKHKNGGMPTLRHFRTPFSNSWADDHIEILAIKGIGGEWGIDSDSGLGSEDLIEEWNYPKIGIVFCEMPSAGHDAVMLNYAKSGPTGNPSVAYIDEDRVPREIAESVEDFFEGLY